MLELFEPLNAISYYAPLIRTAVTVIVVFAIFSLLLSLIKRRLLKKVKQKKQVSNIEIFSKVLKIFFFLILVILALSSYYGSWTGFGIWMGLFSAALGWALQKPITGIAAWLMIVAKRPFDIGDRVIIGSVRGDVIDITLSHIYLNEIGGLVAGEENSGRVILVPNSTLFEQNIINYTQEDEYTLDQVVVLVTFDSNIDKAMKIALESAHKYLNGFDVKEQPYVRTFFQPSVGINVHVRYYVPAKRVQEFSSQITKDILDRIMRTKDVKMAYPHTEVAFKARSS